MKKTIGLNGKQGSGKTTLAQALVSELPNSTVIKFAQPLYDILKLVKVKIIESNLLYDLNSEIEKSVLYKNLVSKIHAYLRKYSVETQLTHINFNEQKTVMLNILKEYFSNINLDSLSTDKITNEDGILLQKLGTDLGRDLIDVDIWAKILKYKVDHNTKYDYIIVDDMRFENEFNILSDDLKVRLDCDENVRKLRAEKWRDNTSHPSEIGLDQYATEGKFDLYFNTENKNVNDIVTEIKSLVV